MICDINISALSAGQPNTDIRIDEFLFAKGLNDFAPVWNPSFSPHPKGLKGFKKGGGVFK